jgi:uncharacterized membrane protein YbaN (DUF454 family)
MMKKMKRGMILTGSVILIIIGIVGIIAPIIPGIPFLLLGLSLLGVDAPELIKKYIS